MATLGLTVKSDFDQATKDLKSFTAQSETTTKAIKNFQESFKTDQIDKFTDRQKLNNAAITATRGKLEANQIELRNTRNEIEKLIRKGLDPEDDAIKRLRADYDKLSTAQENSANAQKGMNILANAGVIAVKTLAAAVIAGSIALGTFISDASDAAELQNKFNVVFSGMEKSTEDWIDTYSFDVARGSEATKQFITDLQDLQTGYGASTEEAAKFSQVVVGVTNDLSSFANVPIEEASAAMSSGLSGQFQALKRLGVGVNVAIINQSEYAESLGKTWLEMTNLEKREAILSEVVKQSKNAVGQTITSWEDYNYKLGDAAKTSESFANQQQLATGLLKDISSAIGTYFLPAATEMLSGVNDILKDFKQWAKDGENIGNMINILVPILGGLTAGMIAFFAVFKGGAILSAIATGFKAINAAIAANPIGLIAVIITTVLVPAIIYLIKNWDSVVLVFQTTIAKIGFWFESVGITLKQAWTVAFNSVKIAVLELAQIIFNRLIGNVEIFLSIAEKIPFVGEKFTEAKEFVTGFKDEINGTIEAMQRQGEVAIEEGEKQKELLQSELENKIESFNMETEARREALEAQKLANDEVQEAITAKDQEETEKRRSLFDKLTSDTTKNALQNAKTIISNFQSMGNSIATILENAGEESRGWAIAQKAINIALATVNTALAVTNALATVTPFPAAVAAAASAGVAGALQVAAIASTPIPSAQTGTSREGIITSNGAGVRDNVAVMAAPGEKVTVEPRGTTGAKETKVNIYLDSEVLYSVTQKGIDSGEINITFDNIQGAMA